MTENTEFDFNVDKTEDPPEYMISGREIGF
jgi:hypothetical protein